MFHLKIRAYLVQFTTSDETFKFDAIIKQASDYCPSQFCGSWLRQKRDEK